MFLSKEKVHSSHTNPVPAMADHMLIKRVEVLVNLCRCALTFTLYPYHSLGFFWIVANPLRASLL